MSGPSETLLRDLMAAIPNLRAFALSLCNDHSRADDLVQETLMRAWTNLSSFEEGTNLKAWLFTILRNNFFSEHRKRRREVEDGDGLLSARLAVNPTQQGHMDFQDVTLALTRLPPDQREALILIGAEGFSYEEAANISGCAVGTIKSRVNRGRRRLIQLLNVEADGGPILESQTSRPGHDLSGTRSR
jgi:RNA polymerase sigma-70 factor, ECF subfamily